MVKRRNYASPNSRPTPGRPELILVTKSEAGLEMRPNGFASTAGANVGGLSAILAQEGVTCEPLFGVSETVIRQRVLNFSESVPLPDMGTYYHVEAPEDQLEELAERLQELDEVEGAYVKPAGEPPIAIDEEILRDMVPATNGT